MHACGVAAAMWPASAPLARQRSCQSILRQTHTAGYLQSPPSRNLVHNSNYCPDCLAAGGPALVSGGLRWPARGGGAGICGDPGEGPRQHEAGGVYGKTSSPGDWGAEHAVLQDTLPEPCLAAMLRAPMCWWCRYLMGDDASGPARSSVLHLRSSPHPPPTHPTPPLQPSTRRAR